MNNRPKSAKTLFDERRELFLLKAALGFILLAGVTNSIPAIPDSVDNDVNYKKIVTGLGFGLLYLVYMAYTVVSDMQAFAEAESVKHDQVKLLNNIGTFKTNSKTTAVSNDFSDENIIQPKHNRLVYKQPELNISELVQAESLLTLTKLRNVLENTEHAVIEIEDSKKFITKRLGFGKSKSIYDIGDNRVIAIPNSSCHYKQLNEKTIQYWHLTTLEESSMASHLRMLGLMALEYQSISIKFEGGSAIILTAPSFETLQVIDHRWGREGVISSMLFGTVSNLKNEQHLIKLFEDIVQDISILIANNLAFRTIDSYNLIIEDTSDTQKYDSAKPGLYSDRKQKLRLFFYDLTGAYVSTKMGNHSKPESFIDENKIIRDAEFCLDEVRRALLSGLTSFEYKSFESSGLDLDIESPRSIIMDNFEKIQPVLVDVIKNNVNKYLDVSDNCDNTVYEFK